jgi:plasmid stabilization system protein ParE
MNYRYVPGARSDYIDLANYFDDARRDFGAVFAKRMREFISRILLHPQLYAAVNRAPRGRDVREGVLEQFEQIVVTYEVRIEEIVILAITDGKRKRRPWRSRLSEL